MQSDGAAAVDETLAIDDACLEASAAEQIRNDHTLVHAAGATRDDARTVLTHVFDEDGLHDLSLAGYLQARAADGFHSSFHPATLHKIGSCPRAASRSARSMTGHDDAGALTSRGSLFHAESFAATSMETRSAFLAIRSTARRRLRTANSVPPPADKPSRRARL